VCRELLAEKAKNREKIANNNSRNNEKNLAQNNSQEIAKDKENFANDEMIIRGFDLPKSKMPDGVESFYGDVTDPASLVEFMKRPGKNTKIIVIHCAGIVSISSHYDPKVYEVNVLGTRTVLHAVIDAGCDKFVHISSVHAIPEKSKGEIIREVDHFNAEKVHGLYAKTKAEAAQYVIDIAMAAKLDYNIIHPSGIIGPYDSGHNHTSSLIIDFYKHRLTSAVNGGYDFVDVRDVASGIISAAKNGRNGSCYILSNRYFTVRELLDTEAKVIGRKPLRSYLALWFVKLTAPLAEMYYKIRKVPPLFTAYSLYTIESNANFSHERADRDLNYKTRPLEETIRDSLDWFKKIKLIK
jgi:dihydroflavonol-4-reductase